MKSSSKNLKEGNKSSKMEKLFQYFFQRATLIKWDMKPIIF